MFFEYSGEANLTEPVSAAESLREEALNTIMNSPYSRDGRHDTILQEEDQSGDPHPPLPDWSFLFSDDQEVVPPVVGSPEERWQGDGDAGSKSDGDPASETTEEAPDPARTRNSIIEHMQDALWAKHRGGEPGELESHLKQAAELAQTVNFAEIALRAEQNPEQSQDHISLGEAASTAMLDYGTYLAENGRLAEAQQYLLQVAVDNPRLIYTWDAQARTARFRDEAVENAYYELVRGNHFDQPEFLGQVRRVLHRFDREDPIKHARAEYAIERLDEMTSGLSGRNQDLDQALTEFIKPVEGISPPQPRSSYPALGSTSSYFGAIYQDLSTPLELKERQRSSSLNRIGNAILVARRLEEQEQQTLVSWLKGGLNQPQPSYSTMFYGRPERLDFDRESVPYFADKLDRIDWRVTRNGEEDLVELFEEQVMPLDSEKGANRLAGHLSELFSSGRSRTPHYDEAGRSRRSQNDRGR